MCPRIVVSLAACVLLAPLTHATKAIANWDVVPFQRISEPLNVGVVAFHETGVDVQFQVNGADAGLVKDPTLNPHSNVWEYWITVDPAQYEDGPITIAATAIPEGAGNENRELEPLTLFANTKGTVGSSAVVWMAPDGDDANDGSEASPVAGFKKAGELAGDGGTIYLKAGDYKLTSFGKGSQEYWTTVSGAPGLTPEAVQILTSGPDKTSTNRYGADKIRWRNLSIYCDRPDFGKFGNLFYFNNGQETWFDGVTLYDKNGRLAGTSPFNGKGSRVWQSDVYQHDFGNAAGGWMRNVRIKDICSDIFRGHNNLFAVNVFIDTIDRGDTEAHPDFIQFHNPNETVENVILYNVSCYDMTAQGFFGAAGGVRDVAFVNVLLEKTPPGVAFVSQLGGDIQHLLIWNVTIVNQSFNFRTPEPMDQVYVQNGAFSQLSSAKYDHPGFFINASHSSSKAWNQPDLMGANATTGELIYVNYDAKDFRQAPDSPAYGTGALPPGVPADIDGVPYDPAAPNRGAFAKANPGRAQ